MAECHAESRGKTIGTAVETALLRSASALGLEFRQARSLWTHRVPSGIVLLWLGGISLG